jgi:predicted nucleic acid-binding protein
LVFSNAGKHYELLANFMADAQVLDLTIKVVDESIEIRKHNKTKLPDAIIAATAIANNLILVSRNISDFKKIKGLKLVDPHNL